MRLPSLLTVLLLPLALSGWAQSASDTAFLTAAIRNMAEMYRQGIGAQARLYNGSKYVAPEYSLDDHPYYQSVDWIPGDVFYDGELFRNVPLMLDLNIGQLITEHYSNGQPLRLVQEKVSYFTISGHRFEKVENESVANSLPSTGYYEILYGGRTKVIARRQKLLHEEIENAEIHTTFEERNHFYILKDGMFHPLRGKRSALKLLADRKLQLRKFARQKKQSLRKNRELLYTSLAEYYDSLMK